MVMRHFCCLLAMVFACATACRAEESSGATLVRKCLATRDVARRFRLMMSLNRELRWADEATALRFVLGELYPCKGAPP